MKKKIIISCMAVALLVAIAAVGFGVSANYTNTHPRQEAYAENWIQKLDAAPIKTIKAEESATLDKEAVLSGNGQETAVLSAAKTASAEKAETETLTYAVTNTMEEENPLDVYRDSNLNEYRYNQEGELDTYRQSLSDKKDLPYGEEPCTEEESIKLAWAYLQKLYGDRIEGVTLNYCRKSGQYNADYDVDFARRYGVDGFIEGPGAFAIIQATGDLSGATICDDMMEDFNPECVEGLTKQMVEDQLIPNFEATTENCVSGSSEIKWVSLERYEDGFRLRVLIECQLENGEIKREKVYYNLY